LTAIRAPRTLSISKFTHCSVSGSGRATARISPSESSGKLRRASISMKFSTFAQLIPARRLLRMSWAHSNTVSRIGSGCIGTVSGFISGPPLLNRNLNQFSNLYRLCFKRFAVKSSEETEWHRDRRSPFSSSGSLTSARRYTSHLVRQDDSQWILK
jgi:hypothetical protein